MTKRTVCNNTKAYLERTRRTWELETKPTSRAPWKWEGGLLVVMYSKIEFASLHVYAIHANHIGLGVSFSNKKQSSLGS